MNKIITTILLLSINLVVKAQIIDNAYLECHYRFSYLKDTLQPNEEINDYMILRIGKNSSKFYSYNTFTVDSLRQVDINSGGNPTDLIANKAKYGRRGGSAVIFKNHPGGRLTYIDHLAKDYYRYEEVMPVQTWSILDEKKDILGYTCRKAECTFRGRKYIAWFTTEIPVSNGPWKFWGLPGLILEVRDIAGHYNFDFGGINKVNNLPIEIEQKQYMKTTQQKHQTTYRKFLEDPIAFISASSNVTITFKNENTGKPKKLKFDLMER